jgi:hypothetical protein
LGTQRLMPRLTLKEERVALRLLVESVTSRSTRIPVGLRMEAARRLLTTQRIISDYLDLIALEMQDQLGEEQEDEPPPVPSP